MSHAFVDSPCGCPCAIGARKYERETLAAKLEAELYDEHQGDDAERAYRRGWNEHAKSVVRELRGGS